MVVGPTTVKYCYIGVYIFGAILIFIIIETKAGAGRERFKKLTTDGKSPIYLASKTEWLLLDITQTDFPVYKPENLYWDAVIMIRKLLLSVVMNFMTHTPKTQCVFLIIIFQVPLLIQKPTQTIIQKQH